MKHATASCLLVIASLLIGCGDDVSGDGSTTSSSASTGATTATTGAEASVGASTGGGDVGSGGGGGDGGNGGAPGVGGAASTASTGSGGAGATPEACFEIHEESACYAAGCNLFLLRPEVLTVDDDVCQATDDLGMCFLADEEGGGNTAPAAYVRDFEAAGPLVIGLTMEFPLYGWTRCTDELAQEVPGCCCDRGTLGRCEDVVPLPPEE